jgi:hypothetical protein
MSEVRIKKAKVPAPQLPPGLQIIDSGSADGKRPLGAAEPPAHAHPIAKGEAFAFKGRHFATADEAIEAKIAEHFKETHKTYIGVAEIAKWIRTHIDVLKKICGEKPTE